jgi:hypothetical protein
VRDTSHMTVGRVFWISSSTVALVGDSFSLALSFLGPDPCWLARLFVRARLLGSGYRLLNACQPQGARQPEPVVQAVPVGPVLLPINRPVPCQLPR